MGSHVDQTIQLPLRMVGTQGTMQEPSRDIWVHHVSAKDSQLTRFFLYPISGPIIHAVAKPKSLGCGSLTQHSPLADPILPIVSTKRPFAPPGGRNGNQAMPKGCLKALPNHIGSCAANHRALCVVKMPHDHVSIHTWFVWIDTLSRVILVTWLYLRVAHSAGFCVF